MNLKTKIAIRHEQTMRETRALTEARAVYTEMLHGVLQEARGCGISVQPREVGKWDLCRLGRSCIVWANAYGIHVTPQDLSLKTHTTIDELTTTLAEILA